MRPSRLTRRPRAGDQIDLARARPRRRRLARDDPGEAAARRAQQRLEALALEYLGDKAAVGRTSNSPRSSASSTRYMARGWSTALIPLILGAMSEITIDTLTPNLAAYRVKYLLFGKVALDKIDIRQLSMGRISEAMTRP
jgi:hypothetical protein